MPSPMVVGYRRLRFDQYGATLVQWFGVSAANILPIFPSLANFTTQNLGFLTPTDRLPRLRIASSPAARNRSISK
jgi:hypothetical protein